MDIENYLNSYLDECVKNFKYSKVIKICENIIDQNYIEGFDDYPRELLALELEKQIMMSVEIDGSFEESFFDKLKMKQPFLFKNKELLKENINLYLNSRSILENYDLSNVRNFYDKVILERSSMRTNKLVTLPGGEKVSLKEIALAINRTLKPNNLKKDEFDVKKTGKKAKKAVAIGAVVSATTIALVFGKNENTSKALENVTEITTDISNDEDFKLPQAGVANFITNQENILKYDALINNIDEVQTNLFVGYPIDVLDEDKNKLIAIKQKYIYDMCLKYGVDFNNVMTIWHKESGGNFNNDGVENEWHDLGEMQINEYNLDVIEKHFGYSREDILNDWQKNIEVAVWQIKRIENMYDKNDFENIFGCYNGWILWNEKPLAIEYSKKAVDLRINKYNKNMEELFEDYMEESNAKGL